MTLAVSIAQSDSTTALLFETEITLVSNILVSLFSPKILIFIIKVSKDRCLTSKISINLAGRRPLKRNSLYLNNYLALTVIFSLFALYQFNVFKPYLETRTAFCYVCITFFEEF